MAKLEKFTEEDMNKTPEELFGGIAFDESIQIRGLPYEDKVRFFKYCMNYDGLVNASALVNIAFVVYSPNISEELFSDANFPFNNLEEYVDIKYDLKTEIRVYGENLLKYFLGALKSYGVILHDNKIEIPASYRTILLTSSFKDISKLMRTYHIEFSEIPLVFGADEIINRFTINDSPALKMFVQSVMDGLKDDTVN